MSPGSIGVSDDALVLNQWTLYESRNATRKWLHNSRRSWIQQEVRKWCPRAQRALEVGPGSGIYIPLLQEVCREVWVSDCEEAYLAPIEERYANEESVKVFVDDITASRLPAECFDLILCTEVVEHVADSMSAIRNLARALKPQGVLVLSTPQRYSFLESCRHLSATAF